MLTRRISISNKLGQATAMNFDFPLCGVNHRLQIVKTTSWTSWESFPTLDSRYPNKKSPVFRKAGLQNPNKKLQLGVTLRLTAKDEPTPKY
ncbi:hypothetical protein [Sulfuricella sp. T08]|uniref:hypothetical protein n=1 Tax=Sulfuricella sp. T08 TaxID=1632857 RepID=UPI00131F1819|nr:hypothetical protein [Sulfuricella sp. T08]